MIFLKSLLLIDSNKFLWHLSLVTIWFYRHFYFIFHRSPYSLIQCCGHTQLWHFPNMSDVLIPCFCLCIYVFFSPLTPHLHSSPAQISPDLGRQLPTLPQAKLIFTTLDLPSNLIHTDSAGRTKSIITVPFLPIRPSLPWGQGLSLLFLMFESPAFP